MLYPVELRMQIFLQGPNLTDENAVCQPVSKDKDSYLFFNGNSKFCVDSGSDPSIEAGRRVTTCRTNLPNPEYWEFAQP